MKIEVIDKETGKIRWTENHDTKDAALKAVKDLKENNFNPNFFKFVIKA